MVMAVAAFMALSQHGELAKPVIREFLDHRSDKVSAKAQALLAGVTP